MPNWHNVKLQISSLQNIKRLNLSNHFSSGFICCHTTVGALSDQVTIKGFLVAILPESSRTSQGDIHNIERIKIKLIWFKACWREALEHFANFIWWSLKTSKVRSNVRIFTICQGCLCRAKYHIAWKQSRWYGIDQCLGYFQVPFYTFSVDVSCQGHPRSQD